MSDRSKSSRDELSGRSNASGKAMLSTKTRSSNVQLSHAGSRSRPSLVRSHSPVKSMPSLDRSNSPSVQNMTDRPDKHSDSSHSDDVSTSTSDSSLIKLPKEELPKEELPKEESHSIELSPATLV